MRKIALLIVLMMVFALTTFAADIAVSVTGKSELTFGVNLNDPVATGFTNANTAEIDFTLVSGSSEKGKPEDGAVYGYIKVADWSMAVDNGVWKGADNGDVTAKIVFPMGWVKISGTNNSLNYINVVQNDNAAKDTDDKGINDSVASNGGFVVGLDIAPLAVELGIFSANDWTQSGAATGDVWGWLDDDADQTTAPIWGIVTAGAAAGDDLNDEHAYGMNLKVTADVKPVKIEAGFEMAINSADTGMGLGAKVSADLAPLTAYVGLDATIDGTTTVLEYGFGLGLAIAGIKLTADGSYNEAPDGLDVRAKVDAGGLVAGLGLAVTLELFNLTGIMGADTDADAEYAVIVDASFATATIKPYASLRYGTYTAADNAYTYTVDPVLALTIGAELYLIPNVTFNAKYTSDNLTASADKGKILFITTIAL